MKNKLLVAALLTLSIAMPLSSCASVPTPSNTSSATSTEVSQASISITGDSSVLNGDTVQLRANVKNLSNYSLKWKSSDSSIAQVNENGLVSTVSSVDQDKEITITCEVVGKPTLKASHKLTVKKDTSTDRISVTISGQHNVNVGRSITLTATVKNTDNKAVTWSSSDETIATVSNGVVTAKTNVAASTSIKITATSVADNSKYAIYIVNVVVPGPVKVTISGADHVTMGKTLQLTSSVENAYNEALTWTSSNESIATVEDGLVTALVNDHNTQVTITATSVQDTTKSDSITLAVWVGEKEKDDIFVEQISLNQNFKLFDTNKNVDDKLQTGFKLKDKEHLIGDDNAADFKPVTVFANYNKVTEEFDTIQYNGDWIYVITIYENVNGKLTEIANDNAYIDGIDYVNCLIDFDESAIGHSFEIKVEPGKLSAGQKTDPDYDKVYVVKYDVTIIDGFNIYKPEELAYIDNRASGIGDAQDPKFKQDGIAWSKYREAHNLKNDYYPNSVVLQSNLTLTVNDIPDRFIWSEGEKDYSGANASLKGTLHDNIRIYEHISANEGGNFSFHGNYFSIDASAMERVKWDENKETAEEAYIVSDAYLFEFRSVNNYVGSAKDTVSTSLMEDVYLKGNGSRTDGPENSGSLIMLANNGNNSVCRNVISISWYQSFSGGMNQYNTMSLQYCKGFDAFTGFVFGYNVHSILIDNCEFAFSGGPCIIAQDWIQDSGFHKSTNVTITNSDIQCYVSGSEGWFVGMGVNMLMGELKALDAALMPKTFLKKLDKNSDYRYMNFICLHMDSGFPEKGIRNLEGSIKIDSNPRYYLSDSTPFGDEPIDPAFKEIYDQTLTEKSPLEGAPVLKSSKGGYGWTDGESLYNEAGQKMVDQDHLTHDLFKGDYLGICFKGMLLTLGYFNV